MTDEFDKPEQFKLRSIASVVGVLNQGMKLASLAEKARYFHYYRWFHIVVVI